MQMSHNAVEARHSCTKEFRVQEKFRLFTIHAASAAEKMSIRIIPVYL